MSTPEKFSFAIGGMTCSACVGRVEKALGNVPGILQANVNLALERADVQAEAGVATLDNLAAAVRKAGFEPILASPGEEQQKQDEQRRHREEAQQAKEKRILILSSLLCAPLVLHMITKFLGFEFVHPPVLEVILATPIQFIIGKRFYVAAYNALRAGAANMDVLVVMGTTAAYLYSWYLIVTLGPAAAGNLYFEASAVIITLVLAGKYMEARAKRGTTAAIRQLMDLRPEVARVRQADGSELEMSITDVQSGDIVIIRPGERLPVDGDVVEGYSEIDESLITGESLPVTKAVGESVTGGSMNGTGLLAVSATKVGADSTLSRIVKLVENAQAGKAPVQRLVDRISSYFVPIVVLIAAITFTGWWFATGNFETALISAVAVLVIACPCALGLATPTAIMTGTGAAARSGILIKDVESLETAHRVNAVIFDKTGTLTHGKPSVVEIVPIDGSEADVLRLAATVQQGSEHPLADAILAAAEKDALDLQPVTNFRSHTGKGVTGNLDEHIIACGNVDLMNDLGIELVANDRIRQFELQGQTVVWIARDGKAIGLLAIADVLRDESAPAVSALRNLGIKTLLLSGDAKLVAEHIGNLVGIDDALGGIKPDGKSTAVDALRDQGFVVAMIGDGINDAPALAAADVGIAMGTGTDIAMETAGITLMRPDPRLVAGSIEASRATFRKIRQNLFWAFIYNVFGIPLAAMGVLTPTLAGAAMALSSVSVVSNSLLLRNWRPQSIPVSGKSQ